MTEQSGVTPSNTGSDNAGGITPAPNTTQVAPAAPLPAAAAPAAPTNGAGAPALDQQTLAQYRAAIVAANPAAIPELIAGDSFAAIDASVAGATAAFTRIAEVVRGGKPAQPAQVPAGGGATLPAVDVSKLSAAGKIQHGLAERKAKSA